MPWLRGGTVAVTNGSTTVVGTNADFAANSRIGDAFVGPDGINYEIGNVASATVISIIPAYKGPTASGVAYAIMPVQGYPKALADAFNNINLQWGIKLAALGTTGNYDILPVTKGGTGGADLNALAKSGANSDITSITGLTTQLAASMGGNGSLLYFLSGLKIGRQSAGKIAIDTGAAYIPSLGRVLHVSAQIVATLPTNMLAGFLYHIYLYPSGASAVPAIEFVIAPNGPPVAYAYPAYMKQGDNSRRYIGSILASSATDCVNFTMTGSRVDYQATTVSAPLQVLALGTATTATGVNCSAVVPPTASHARCLLYNREPSSGPLVRIGNSLIGATSANSRSFVLQSNAFESDVLLDSAQQFYYSYDGTTPVTGFTARVLGYILER